MCVTDKVADVSCAPGPPRPPRLSRCERSDAEARGLTRAETPSYQATNRSTKPVLNNKLRAAITLTRKRCDMASHARIYLCLSVSARGTRALRGSSAAAQGHKW